MEKEEYLSSIETNIESILNDYIFNNYKKQLVAKKLGASFNPTYKEEYLRNKLLYISANSCTLLSEGVNEKLTSEAFKVCGTIYEDLSEISVNYDTEYCLILSALCYDLAGYPANTLCLMKRLETQYAFETQDEALDINNDNYILKHIQQILLKNIPKAKEILNHQLDKDVVIRYFNKTIELFYDNILNGVEGDFIGRFNKQYQHYLKKFNIPMAHLFLLLRAKIAKYIERSIWNNLNVDVELKKNPKRKMYIKLLTYDLYAKDKIKNIDNRVSIFELWLSQLRAIEAGLLENPKNFIIQMPTSAGKTFIGEISILNHLIKFPEKKCIYIAPFKALTNEKEDELSKNLSRLGYSVSTLSGSYEIDEYQRLLMEETDVLIATPEKIDLLFRLDKNYFNNVSLIVIDEGHIVGNKDQRGSLLEFLIIRLKIKLPDTRMLFISAVMPSINANEYSSWLNNGDSNNVIRALLNKNGNPNEQWEPTLKLIGKFKWAGTQGRIDFKDISTEDETTKANQGVFIPGIIEVKKYGTRGKIFPHPNNKAETAACLAWKLSEKGGTFIFCGKPLNVLSICNAYLELFELEEFTENPRLESYFYAKLWLGEEHPITNCIKRGIGAHYGDLPEQLRNSVENDFRKGRLKILISTNTIGQGINLPIRNVIFHSTLMNVGLPIRCNDFLNIIGRAGRAGMETEGKIIFISDSPTDEKMYEYLTNKDNLEPSNSLFFNILKWLTEEGNNYNNEDYESDMSILSEPYLFDLMLEGNLSESEAIEAIINNSLFKIQIEANSLDISILRKSLINVYTNIKEHVDKEALKIYGMTGLSLKSNQLIHGYIEANKEIFENIIKEDDYIQLLATIFNMVDKYEIEEISIEKLNKIPLLSCMELIYLWINGATIVEIRKKWAEMKLSPEKLFVLMSQGFEYRFPWVIYSFLIILSYSLGLDLVSIPVGIKNLGGYIKFGTNDPNMCLARTIGIKSRDSAKILSSLFKSAGGGTPKDFIRFISNLQYEEIQEIALSQYELDNINNTSLKLRPKEKAEEKTNIPFEIKGISYKEERKSTSLEMTPGDILSVRREYDNPHDPYAILLYKDDKELGYLPKELSKIIGINIDLENTVYVAKILNVRKGKQYNNIYCELLR